VGLSSYTSRVVTQSGFQVEREGGEVVLAIEVPPEAVREKERELLALVRAKLRVPGFRHGKAPEHLALRYYGEAEFAGDLQEELVREWIARALKELDLHPVTTPAVETVAFVRGERLALKVTFAVVPELAISDELTVNIPEPPPVNVTDEDVAGALAELRRDLATLEPKLTPAEEGDVVRLRRGKRDWEGEATSSHPMRAQLLGARVGATLTVVDEGGRSEEFTVTDVYQVTLPAPDETAARYGLPSWEALGQEMREGMVRVATGRRLRAWQQAALDAVADAFQVEVPPTLLSEAVAEETKELQVPPDQKPQLTEIVRQRLRREIVAKRVAEAKGLRPDEAEVNRLVEEGTRDEGAVRAALVFEQAADWVIAQTVPVHRREAEDAGETVIRDG